MKFDSTVNLGMAISVAIFFLGYLIAHLLKRQEVNNKRHKLLLALSVEVELNIKTLKEALQEYPKFHDTAEFMNSHNGKAPYLIFTFNNDIYRRNVDLLADLESVVIRNIISFYGNLQYISDVVNSMFSQSFETISPNGREKLYIHLRENIERTEEKGDNLLAAFSLLLSKANLS